ncbi:uncharacterized protein LOC116308701 [Actinia tenebrosa]|uniref:Uncharacterized protein LOC116308701 n=1 Tax=Actinia tenebrosa TaxID=6105 RepID=A0A6P8J5P9_ACTTE|nr:uncharacterized protein LOC116308701 [Actinia tenebrosa]
MAIQENFILYLILVSIAHLDGVLAADFDLCGLGDITSKDGSIFFNISEVGSEGEIECRRLIHVDKGHVRLTINTSEAVFQGKNILQVFDGGFNARQLNSEGPKGQITYESSGNVMAILLRVEKSAKSTENIVRRGTFISLPFQTTCACGGIQNGVQQCWESFGVRKCEATCKNGFVDLTESTGNFSCSLLNGKWDKDLDGFGCQSTILPSVVFRLNLTFANASLCTASTKDNISTFFNEYFKDNKNISANGQCFGQHNASNCTVIECVENDNSSFVSITIEDKSITKSKSVEEKPTVVDLFTVYNSTSKGIEEQLFAFINNILKNTSALNKAENNVERQCPSGLFLFLNAGDIGHPVCSKCPAGRFYSAFKCEKCPNGTFSLEGSVTCSPDESQKITPSSKDLCKIYCSVGKGLNLTTGFCQWCPYDTYQNSTDVPNVNCSACPKGKMTPYPGATGMDQCYVPCKKGTFFSLKDQKCLSCPLGTYQESGNHLFMRCKNCGLGKVTYENGSTAPDYCVTSCPKGRYLDSTTSQCLECPLGSYQDKVNQLNCTRCRDGTFTLKNGSIERNDCIKTCLMGTYFDVQNQSCIECPVGTYMDQNGHLILSCIKCAGNKTTQGHGAINESQCLGKCDVGEYLNTQNNSCSKCPVGTYMDQKGNLLLSCIKCVDNKTTHVEGAGNENHCLHRCKPGEFFVAENASCPKCPSGTFMEQNNHLIKSCNKCGANQTTQNEGAVDKSQCIDTCGKGEYFSVKNSSCALCPLGTYMDEGGHLRLSCKTCGNKNATYKKGAVSENQCMIECKVGQYFNSTTSTCEACPKGSYQNKTAQETCLSCPPGMSTTSAGETSVLACVKYVCGRGKYVESTGNCQLCPNGTYQSAVNHTLSSCQQCPSNISKVQGATNLSSCIKICDSFPCENGAECIEKADAYCKCPRGLTGKRCEVIEKQDELIKLQMGVRFTSLHWSEQLTDKTSSEYRGVKYRIENSLRNVFIDDESFVGVQVNKLVKGSVIANFDLYMNENASVVPAKTLQIAVKHGSIGGLAVDAEYLSIKQVTCDRALGMENGRIKDEQISASSKSANQHASRARLNSPKGWHAKEVTSKNYIQVRFHSNVNVTAIATQGDAVGSFVTAYVLSYSTDGDVWMDIKESINSTFAKNFTANNDTNTIVKNILPEPITLVKYIRVIPVSWSNATGMRIEVYGCITDPILPPEEIPTTFPKQTLMTEPKVKAVASNKDEYSWGKYLGITFGLLMVVGCLLAFFMWWRSSKKKEQKEKAPLVMTKLHGNEYKVINKNDDLEYDENAV